MRLNGSFLPSAYYKSIYLTNMDYLPDVILLSTVFLFLVLRPASYTYAETYAYLCTYLFSIHYNYYLYPAALKHVRFSVS